LPAAPPAICNQTLRLLADHQRPPIRRPQLARDFGAAERAAGSRRGKAKECAFDLEPKIRFVTTRRLHPGRCFSDKRGADCRTVSYRCSVRFSHPPTIARIRLLDNADGLKR
jgi:hypothetical protein